MPKNYDKEKLRAEMTHAYTEPKAKSSLLDDLSEAALAYASKKPAKKEVERLQNLLSTASDENKDYASREEARVLLGLEAMDFAVPGAGKLAGLAGIMIGPRALKANTEALVKALGMRKKGASDEDIWAKTGWMQDPADKQWKSEVSDAGARMRYPEQYKARPRAKSDYWRGPKNVGKLGDHFSHMGLFSNYPEARNLDLVIDYTLDARGAINVAKNKLAINPMRILESEKYNTLESTVVHELQHYVQRKEMFGVGANTDDYAVVAKRLADDIASLDKVVANPAVRAYDSALRLKKIDAANEIRNKNPIVDTYRDAAAEYGAKNLAELQNVSKTYHKSKHLFTADAMYTRTAGELEARTAQERLSMTAKERLENPIWNTVEWNRVPVQERIFLKANEKLQELNLGKTMPKKVGFKSSGVAQEKGTKLVGPGLPPKGRLAPAIRPYDKETGYPKDTIYHDREGGFHATVYDTHSKELFDEGFDQGYVDSAGKFYSRKEADEYLASNYPELKEYKTGAATPRRYRGLDALEYKEDILPQIDK